MPGDVAVRQTSMATGWRVDGRIAMPSASPRYVAPPTSATERTSCPGPPHWMAVLDVLLWGVW